MKLVPSTTPLGPEFRTSGSKNCLGDPPKNSSEKPKTQKQKQKQTQNKCKQ